MHRFFIQQNDPARTLRVSRFHGREGASRCFRFDAQLDVASEHDPVEPIGLLGKQVVLQFGSALDEPRRVAGVVLAVRDERAGVVRVRIGPRLETLRHQRQNRIFQGLSVPEIVDQVLDDAGKLPRVWRLKGDHPVRNYVVRYRESHLAFIQRLLGDEGIFFFFDHDAEERGDVIVFGDDASAYTPIGAHAALRYAVRADEGALTGDEVQRLRIDRRAVPAATKLSAYDPDRPLLALAASAAAGGSDAAEPGTWVVQEHGEVSQVRNGRVGTVPEITDGRAQTRLEQHRRRAWRAEGTSVCPLLRPGSTFALTGRNPALGAPPEGDPIYVCADIEHEGRDLAGRSDAPSHRGLTYENRFACAPATDPIRPAPAVRRALHVAETAIVVGPPGQDVYTDSYGRVKVQFFWDPDGKRDETSSCWLRVVQAWAGPGMGLQLLPRVGMEVLVTFLHGDPDQPVVVGTLSNVVTPPPFDPSKEPTKSGIRSRSVPGPQQGEEERFHELSFDDRRGAECVTLRAQRDLSVTVGTRYQLGVGELDLYARGALVERVDRDAELHVGGLRVEHLSGGVQRQVAGDLHEVVTGLAALSAGGGSSRIQGDRDEDVAGEVTTRIGGCSTTIVGTPSAPASWTVQASGSVVLAADGAIEIASPKGVVLRCGDTELRVGPAGLDIVGPALRFADPTGVYSFSVGPKGVRAETPAEFRVQAKTAVLYGTNACLQLSRQVSVQGEEILLNSPEQARDTAPDEPRVQTKIAILDQDGKPVAGARFIVHLGDECRSGVADGNGCAVLQCDPGAKPLVEWPGLAVKTSAGQAPTRRPLGARSHVIKDGEHLAGLAHTWGLDPDAIWADARNADLRSKRKDFHIL